MTKSFLSGGSALAGWSGAAGLAASGSVWKARLTLGSSDGALHGTHRSAIWARTTGGAGFVSTNAGTLESPGPFSGWGRLSVTPLWAFAAATPADPTAADSRQVRNHRIAQTLDS